MKPFRQLILSVVILAPGVSGQTAAESGEPVRVHAVAIDSGVHSNSGDVSALVFSEVVDVPGARWFSLLFDSINLPGDSYIVVDPHAAGERQILRGDAIGSWQNSVPPVPGGRATVELHAGPRTSGNRFAITRVVAGMPLESGAPQEYASGKKSPRKESICDPADLRTPFARNSIARLVRLAEPGAYLCTATLAVCPGGCSKYVVMVSAGHCFRAPDCGTGPTTLPTLQQFVEFNVPASLVTCQINFSALSKQFPVREVVARNCGPGDDWAVFLVDRNALTGNTVVGEQRDFMFFQFAGASARLATLSGYGKDGGTPPYRDDANCPACIANNPDAERNFTLQRHHTYITRVAGDLVTHRIQMCGADSGAPIYVNGNAGREIIAINTHHTLSGMCALGSTSNLGTNLTNSGLQAAIAQMCARARELAGPAPSCR